MKLGELFVDLGVNSGGAMNILTNFGIKFLTLKNTASQLADVFENIFGDTSEWGQELLKQNQISGLSIQWLQKMKASAEQTGTSFESVLSTIKNLQKENADILMGKGNIEPFTKLNIDMSKLRDPINLLDEILSKVSRLEPAFRQAMLSELGISEDILFMYQQKTLELEKSLNLTKQETESLNDLQKEWTYLKQSIGNWWDKKFSGWADVLSSFMAMTRFFFSDNPEDRKRGLEFLGRSNFLDDEINEEENINTPEQFEKEFEKSFKESAGVPNITVDDGLNKSFLESASLPNNITYTDNSQTTINTSEGAETFKRISNNKVNNIRSIVNGLGNVEMQSRRG